MGGGGAMRAAAKVAGIGVVNGGLRGVPAVSPAEHTFSAAARTATRPVSAIASSSDDVKSNVLIASQNDKIDASMKRPSWEIDDWEFAGGEDDLLMEYGEPMPRLVFGSVPTLQEAKEATSELKDAIVKVYLSSPKSLGGGGSFIAGQESGLSLLPNLEHLETKACVTSETPKVPKNALQAFKFLNESPAAQTVVASIASDPNVWNAVLQNDTLVEFLQSHKSTAHFKDMDSVAKESVADVEFQNQQAPKCFDKSSNSGQAGDFGNGFMGFVQNIKLTVVHMMSSLSDYFQNLFGGPDAEKVSTDTDGSARKTVVDKALGASFMGLAVMVIMVVVLKRG
ncbi:hypothetical protein F0562_008866 [Nyssa sinensis]|uniref:Uncharacterized protein n=1 Tax=Nyssa sinensis TaxID=561372 RepID=A0A5J5A729_9ASTE|nr:hypothetical protein F0562_008866 [Nyssa sinensis]